MTNLSVNINKVALIRNARGQDQPNLIQIAQDCEEFGAQGITVHPRPDERHVKFSDLLPLKEVVKTEFNIEGFPSEKFIEHVLHINPHQVTLVPDPPGVLTSNTGWDTESNLPFLQDTISKFKEKGIRTSIFLNPEPSLVASAAETGTDRIELYTGNFAKMYEEDPGEAIKEHILTAKEALKHKLGLNAGHDLNLKNLHFYQSNVPNLLEVSIGHALICDALYFGLQNTIGMYLRRLNM